MKIKVKVGSSALVHQGELQYEAFTHISDQASRLVDEGHQVAVTTSGFIAAAGRKSQEAYSHGGARIVAEWQHQLGDKFGSLQLVSRASLSQSVELIQSQMDEGKVAFANGYFGDRCFGGNDQLAVAIAQQLNMDRVVLLGDMNGIRRNMEDANTVLTHVELDRIEDYRQYIGSVSLTGTGGIDAKFAAARDAADSGIVTHYGHWQASFEDMLSSTVGTTFLSANQRPGIEQRNLV